MSQGDINHDRNGDEGPKDKYHLVYIIFFLAGIGVLLPWQFFVTAIPYFQYKLRNVANATETTQEQRLFANYLALCAMLPLAIFNMLNLVIMRCIPAFTRYIIGSVIAWAMFLLTAILVRVELSSQAFLAITLTSVVIINAACAIFQGSLLGIASVLPPRNIGACLEGQAVAGVLAAVAQIISIAASSHFTTSALAYFLVALFFLGAAIILTLLLKKNAYFRYYWDAEQEKCMQVEEKDNSTYEKLSPQSPNNFSGDRSTEKNASGFCQHLLSAVKEMSVHGSCICLTLMITLMLFPALLVSIKSMIKDPDSRWANVFFIPVIVFLSFNICDWLGRFVAGYIKWPRIGQRWILLGLCISRIVFVPLCMLMNQQPRFHMPVVFAHDAYPIILIILLGLTNGYYLSLAFSYGPSFASPGNGEAAGIALSIFMSIGLALGVAVSSGLAVAL